MKHKIRPQTPTGINIDFYHFYPLIVHYLNGVLCFSKKYLYAHDSVKLADIIFDWLLNRVNNFTVVPCPRSWRLYHYFDKEDAIEIFDDLFLDFIDFLREKGIDARKHYVVKRGKQNRCICTETHTVTPSFP